MLDREVRPSRFVLQEATQMGQMMASAAPDLRPFLDDAHQYASYTQFMLAHRHRLSRTAPMEPWEARIQRLVEIDAKHNGLKVESPADWDAIEKFISVPIHCAFWYGWEQVHNLWQKYERAVTEHRRAGGALSAIPADADVPATEEAAPQMLAPLADRDRDGRSAHQAK